MNAKWSISNRRQKLYLLLTGLWLIVQSPLSAATPQGCDSLITAPGYASTHVLATQPLRQARTPLPQTLGEADTHLQQTSVYRQHGPPVHRYRLGLWQTQPMGNRHLLRLPAQIPVGQSQADLHPEAELHTLEPAHQKQRLCHRTAHLRHVLQHRLRQRLLGA